MEQIIEASQATISQAVITIKAVRIGKKQMTQSVFNQLPNLYDERNNFEENDLENHDIKIWGYVNYCKCSSKSEHLHLIVEDDGVLKKVILYKLVKSEDDWGYKWTNYLFSRYTWDIEDIRSHNYFYNRISDPSNQLFIAV